MVRTIHFKVSLFLLTHAEETVYAAKKTSVAQFGHTQSKSTQLKPALLTWNPNEVSGSGIFYWSCALNPHIGDHSSTKLMANGLRKGT